MESSRENSSCLWSAQLLCRNLRMKEFRSQALTETLHDKLDPQMADLRSGCEDMTHQSRAVMHEKPLSPIASGQVGCLR